MNVSVRPYVREGHVVVGYSQQRKRKFIIDRAERAFKIYESGGHEFVLPERALRTDAVVTVDVRKFDDAWKRDEQMHIGPGGTGHAIHDRYRRFKEFLKEGQPIEMSEVSFYKNPKTGQVEGHFTNGRHRFAVLRDMGLKTMPVAVSKSQVAEFERMFGPETKQETKQNEVGMKKSELDGWQIGFKNNKPALIIFESKIFSPDDTLLALNQEVNGVKRDQGEYAQALFDWLLDNSYEIKNLVAYLNDNDLTLRAKSEMLEMNVEFKKAKPYYARRHDKWTHIGGYSSRSRTLKLTIQGKYGERMSVAMDRKRPDVRMALSVAEQVRESGGQALIVGGFVRDALLGKSNKDIDVEVYGLSPDTLSGLLSGLGKVDAVGASFGVLKLSHPDLKEPLDVSLPRRESKEGIGHRGFFVEADPAMTIREAERRRDFTVNSISFNPLTKTIHDEFGGLEDLEKGILCAVDPLTFPEDPLRVLRAMRFAAKLGFVIDKNTLALCRTVDLSSLPKERVFGELEQLFTAKKPSLGLRYFADLGLEKIFPEIGRLRETQQDPKFHSEGNAFDHTLMVIDEAAKFRDTFSDPKKFTEFMFAALFHDIGKPDTSYRSEHTGRIISPGHEGLGAKIVKDVMARLTDETGVGNNVSVLVGNHMKPGFLHHDKVNDSAVRRLALKVDILTVVKLSVADKKGRGTQAFQMDAEKWLLDRYKNLSLDKPATLQPLVMGRHLIELGVKPGVEMGKTLKTLFEAQLDGKFSTVEGGLELARQEGLLPEIAKSKRVFVPQSPYHRAYYREDPRTPSPPMEGSLAPPLLQYSDLKELAQRFLTEFVNSDIRDPMGDRIEFAPRDFLHISKIDTGTADKYRCERMLWIKDIIQNPDLVVKDERDPNARLFIKWYHGEPYLFVCRVQDGKFHSVTAYPLESPAKVRALLRQERVYTRVGLLLKSTAGLRAVKVPVKGKTKTYMATRWLAPEETVRPELLSMPLEELSDLVDSHIHDAHDVAEGRVKVGVHSGGTGSADEAKKLGLFATTVRGLPIYAKTKEDAQPLIDYLERGGIYGSVTFSRLLGLYGR